MLPQATGDKVSELKGHLSGVSSVAWSPNGSQVASGSYDNTVIIWDAASGDKVSELKGHTEKVRSVAWSPKGSNQEELHPGKLRREFHLAT